MTAHAASRRAMVLAALLCAVAVRAAHADDGDAIEDGKPDAAVAVVVNAADGVKLAASRKATVAISMERALRRDRRLLVVDQDDRLAARSGAVPADQVAEARSALTIGRAMLARGQAKAAVLKLQGSSTQLARVLAWTQKQDLANAQLYLGTAQAMAGDAKGAVATFVALLAWRPDALPDPDLATATVMPLWGKAAEQVARLGTGSIDITTSPEGALAYVDGNLAGFTPLTVDNLTEGTHYVTLRRPGSMRRVEPVKVTAAAPAKLVVPLDASKRGDELAEAAALLEGRLGDAVARAEAQAGLAAIGELLGVEHVVVVTVQPGDGQYRTYVYAADGGARLGTVDVAVGDRDPEEAFAEAGQELYRQVARAKVKPKRAPKPVASRDEGGPSIFGKKWFWIAAGSVVVAGAATYLILRATDGPAPITCPAGQSCGTVVFRF